MALEEAGHPELQSMAQQMIDSQEQEVAQLQTWRAMWFPDVEPAATATSMP
jgi:uncharacterized protein (DUF305 family)